MSLKPPLISGYSVLETLQHYDAQQDLGIVYHGTTIPLNEISPRDCKKWIRGRYVPDTDLPVVCASDNPTIAAFRALVPRVGQLFGCARVRNSEGGLTFYTSRLHVPELMGTVGYVSLCSGEDFRPFVPEVSRSKEPVMEYRSSQTVTPLCNVEIDYTDFEDLLHADPRNRLEYV